MPDSPITTIRASLQEVDCRVDTTKARVQRGEPEPQLRFQMKALGYANVDWGHGHYRGELAVGAEEWDLSTLNPADPTVQHVHHTVRATMPDGNGGEKVGVGLLEQIIYGPHTQFGFNDLLDMAP